MYSLWPVAKRFPQQFLPTVFLGRERAGKRQPEDSMGSHSLSDSLLSLGLTHCVWEEEQLVIIAWQMCVSLFGGCQASAASGSPERHDVFDSHGALCWWRLQDKWKECCCFWMTGDSHFCYGCGIRECQVRISTTKALHQDWRQLRLLLALRASEAPQSTSFRGMAGFTRVQKTAVL